MNPFYMTGISMQLLLGSLLIVAMFIIYVFNSKIDNKRNYIYALLLLGYVLIVFGATVFCRKTLGYQQIELMPFWIYMEVLEGNPGVTPMDIINNIILLLPIGVLLTCIFPNIRVGNVFVIGFLLSLGIELLQYFLWKGVAQLDDLMHNTLGCVMGWYLCKKLFAKDEKKIANEINNKYEYLE